MKYAGKITFEVAVWFDPLPESGGSPEHAEEWMKDQLEKAVNIMFPETRPKFDVDCVANNITAKS